MPRPPFAAILLALIFAGCGSSSAHPAAATASHATSSTTRSRTESSPAASGGAALAPTSRPAAPHPPFAVAERVATFTDHSRTVEIPGAGLQPRRLVTVVRYPRATGRFPLIVFGHGFAVTPAIYAPLLQAWARAGYVVAAPIFPLENENAPGGPNESDIVNQPADVSFVITQMLRARDFAGRVDAHEVGVSGQSDGGNTALAVAYAARARDRRVRAAVILSGGEVPPVAPLDFAAGPPLLATQGTADTINPPSFTSTFFAAAPRPKYRLDLLGSGHLPPYTGVTPWASVTERATTDFLDYYLKGERGGLGRMRADGNVRGVAALEWYP